MSSCSSIFEKVKDLVPLVEVNAAAAREHVGLIERAIRHLKEKIRAMTSEFPSAWILTLVLFQTVYSCAFLNQCVPESFREFCVLTPQEDCNVAFNGLLSFWGETIVLAWSRD